ncbi:undecaprenyldiphospho-muramoylpentapeptide beta-N-acetylglucosaminyltransferase [Gulbenkiania mobilis]|uniref:undecaprenyldiphospho-muramoylpentapeptide beta-N-acetylglucosaminyltransferase n=1 Tax=Gulbenkiania mobilis TaxID=397457 RepID=UPI000AE2D1CC|nr:undecaprenyldiphospho-muramoylpentapeptide beta-N-acetylglucosaminyltransferase [Gulbenkiania mobilis]
MATKTAMIMAGGTGGHIFPGLAVARELTRRGWKVFWLGAEGGMETKLVPQHGLPIETVRIAGVRGNGLRRKLAMPFRVATALMRSGSIIRRHRPDLAIGFGGYTGFPGGVMSRCLGLPLVVHEQNSVAGLTNRLLSRIASRTLYAFPGAFDQTDGLVGNPVRSEIAALPTPETRFAGRSGPLRLLVVGGSLGAKVFNDLVPQALARLPEGTRPLVTHQAGAKQIEALQANYAAAGVAADCRAFIDDMADAYASADLVICRAGALTVAELAAAGVGSLLVPYPHAVDDHQTGNARYLAAAGAAELVPQGTLSAEGLAETLRTLTRARCLEMAVAARKLGIADAAVRVADVCEALTNER